MKSVLFLIACFLVAACASMPPIVEASASNDRAAVDELLSNGADINSADGTGMTPLMIAITRGHPELADYLIEEGANISKTDMFGRTPTFVAAAYGDQTTIEKLLASGANPNTATTSTMQLDMKIGGSDYTDVRITPLMMAVQAGEFGITQILIENGADPNRKTQNGLTALSLASTTNAGSGFAKLSGDEQAAFAELLESRGANEGISLADANKAAEIDRSNRRARSAEEVQCTGNLELAGLTEDEAKALQYILVRKPHPGEPYCVTKITALDKFSVRDRTVLEYEMTVSFPIGYNSRCLNYKETQRRVEQNFNWEDFDSVATGCNRFAIETNGYVFGGPHAPGAEIVHKGREEI